MNHVVFFSGGIGSWCAAKRVVDEYGSDNVELLFTDTNMEDEDLYRFLIEGSAALEAKLVWIKNDGRTPWDVFFDENFLGNSRIDPCSRILKREASKEWVTSHYEPDEVTLYLGIDWTEQHRKKSIVRNWNPYPVRFPMCEKPYLEKEHQHEIAEECGVVPPRLTSELGFPHNNCGGFCVKAGHAHFKHLLETMPGRYKMHEDLEQELREQIGKDVAILKDRSRSGIIERMGLTETDIVDDTMPNGDPLPKQVPFTLRELRERVMANQIDEQCVLDWGGCGCFTDYEDDE